MIYFLQDPTTLEIKIGYTGDETADGRLSKLQTGNPRDLVLLATMPGDRKVDAALKQRFSPHCVRGEWFLPAPELLEVVLGARRREPAHAVIVGRGTTRVPRLAAFEKSSLIAPRLCFLASIAVGFPLSIYFIRDSLLGGEDCYQVMPDDEFAPETKDFYEWYCVTHSERWPTAEEAAAKFVDGWLAWNVRVTHVRETPENEGRDR